MSGLKAKSEIDKEAAFRTIREINSHLSLKKCRRDENLAQSSPSNAPTAAESRDKIRAEYDVPLEHQYAKEINVPKKIML